MPENKVTQTTTTSSSGSAPRKSSEPHTVHPKSTHNQMTCSIWKVWANLLSFCSNSVSWPSTHSSTSTPTAAKHVVALTSNHHPERSASRHASINAAMTQPSTRTVATLVAACMV